jgi:alpha,alpha-trehalose phosphorylase
MTSFVQLPLFTIEYSVRALNFSGQITFLSTHKGDVMNYFNPKDPRVAGESFRHLLPDDAQLEGECSIVMAGTSKSGLTVCTAVRNMLSKETRITNRVDGATATTTISADVKESETVTLTKYTVFTDSIRFPDCRKAALREMEKACAVPMEAHYRQQKAYLDCFWAQSLLEIEGDEELSIALKYNMYQLLQSVGKDEYCNIAAKGLSGEGYEGHYFWDTEMYIQPFFTLTNPQIARSLISYRYSILDAARENAKVLGHRKGALYPWRTIMGKECSGYFPSGSAQYHIDGDIAYSIVAYYLATKDLDFIAEKGAEIVFETARLWMETGNFCKGKFHIHDVTGPDEYTCLVSDNYFTNASAQYNLHWAVRFYSLLKEGKRTKVLEKIHLTEEEVREFERAEKQMYLPYDAETGINPQDDSFLSKPVWDFAGTPKENYPLLMHYHPLYLYRFQVCKQADTVLAHFIYEDTQDIETIRRSFAYYEKITTHDSSLSTCIYSIVAAKLGDVEKAYGYFGDSAKLDLFNLHHNTKDGIHTANMGGNYMAVVYGFGGLRLKESGLWMAPVLPGQWKSYRFMVCYEGSRILVYVSGTEVCIELCKGDAKEIYVYGNKYKLNTMLKIER